MKQILLLMLIVFYGCTNTFEERFFQFTYEVIIEPTNGKKLELWIPVPKSNEVQTVSNLEFNFGDSVSSNYEHREYFSLTSD